MIEDLLRGLVGDVFRREIAPLVAEIQELRRAVDARLPQRWVTRAEAARALGVSVDSVDRRIADSTLRSQRLGRAVRVLLDAPPSSDEIASLALEARQ